MHFNAISVAAILAIAQPAVADFLIFCGAENQFPDPVQTPEILFFNNPPSCNDVTHKAIAFTVSPNNDASHGGAACDGCDGSKAPQDWDVKRLEIYDDNSSTFSVDKIHFTLYKDEQNGGWGMYDTNMQVLGHCDKPDPVQKFTCPDVLSADGGAGIFHCVTAVTIKNSN